MKVLLVTIIILYILLAGYLVFGRRGDSEADNMDGTAGAGIEVVATGLEVPWGIAFLPDDSVLVTERAGFLTALGDGERVEVTGVQNVGEGGLLGITPHPDFEENRYVYLYQTTEVEGGLMNRVVRYVFEEDHTLTEPFTVVEGIPGARYHDGGRIAFGPDGLLYITTGDAGQSDLAQDTNSLAGKILRLNPDGSIPEDNPFGNEVFSYGHRNPQGLTWDDAGRLWSTEHGRSGLHSGYDELNLIVLGGNYGWPIIQGGETQEGMVSPVLHSGATTTWAPASAQFYQGSIFFAGLRGQTLYEAVLDGAEVVELKEHLAHEYGRLRTVVLGPDGALYMTTSNRDGRGNASENDDRIFRFDPGLLENL